MDKGVQRQFTEERADFSRNGATMIRCLYEKKNLDLYMNYIQNQLKMDHISKPKTIKLLEENMGENLCDLWLGKDFLDITTPVYKRANKLYVFRILNVCSLKDTAKENKKTSHRLRENICKSYI